MEVKPALVLERARVLEEDQLESAQGIVLTGSLERLNALHKMEAATNLFDDGGEALYAPTQACLSERSLLILGPRGYGKSSILSIIHERLGGDERFISVWPPIDVRSLDCSDNILMTLLQRVAGLDIRQIRDSEGNHDSAKQEKKKVQGEWRALQGAALRTHPSYSDFVTATSATEAEFTEFLIQQTSGTESLSKRIQLRIHAMRQRHAPSDLPLVVFYLDDLDLGKGRLVEAVQSIDRYLAVCGTAFVFTASFDTMQDEVKSEFLAGRGTVGDEEREELWEEEAASFMAKMFPEDAIYEMRAWPPRERLLFNPLPEVKGQQLYELLDSFLDGNSRKLFFARSARKDRAKKGLARPHLHADLLPKDPRKLRVLHQLLSGSREPPCPLSDGPELPILMARASGDRAAKAFWSEIGSIYKRLIDGGAQIRQIREELAVEVYSSLPDPKEIDPDHTHPWAMGNSQAIWRRDLLDGELFPLHGIATDEDSMDSRWQELAIDLAMLWEPECDLDMFYLLRLASTVTGATYAKVESAELLADPLPEAKLWCVASDDHDRELGSPLLHLMRFLDNEGPLLPSLVRQQLWYAHTMHSLVTKKEEFCPWRQTLLKPLKAFRDDDGERARWLEAVDSLAAAHIIACLRAHRIKVPVNRSIGLVMVGEMLASFKGSLGQIPEVLRFIQRIRPLIKAVGGEALLEIFKALSGRTAQ